MKRLADYAEPLIFFVGFAIIAVLFVWMIATGDAKQEQTRHDRCTAYAELFPDKQVVWSEGLGECWVDGQKERP